MILNVLLVVAGVFVLGYLVHVLLHADRF